MILTSATTQKKKKKMNQIDFWHDDKGSKITKDGL